MANSRKSIPRITSSAKINPANINSAKIYRWYDKRIMNAIFFFFLKFGSVFDCLSFAVFQENRTKEFNVFCLKLSLRDRENMRSLLFHPKFIFSLFGPPGDLCLFHVLFFSFLRWNHVVLGLQLVISILVHMCTVIAL